MEPIAERCIRLIAEIKKIPVEDIALDSTFEELAFDSLDKVSLAFDIEESFNIDIPESRLASITSVRAMVDGVAAAVAAKQGLAEQAGE